MLEKLPYFLKAGKSCLCLIKIHFGRRVKRGTLAVSHKTQESIGEFCSGPLSYKHIQHNLRATLGGRVSAVQKAKNPIVWLS